MHFVSCKVRLAGNMGMEVVRDAFNPVSYPEVEILRYIHGDDAVLDVKVIGEAEQSARDEKERLSLKYGTSVVETVYPGRNPSALELEMPKAKVEEQPWHNPLDKEVVGFDSDPVIRAEKANAVQAKAKQTKAKTVEAPANPFAE